MDGNKVNWISLSKKFATFFRMCNDEEVLKMADSFFRLIGFQAKEIDKNDNLAEPLSSDLRILIADSEELLVL